MPKYTPPIEVRRVVLAGDLIFVVAESLDEDDEDGEIIEGGDGVLIVAKRLKDSGDTFWAGVCHELFPETLDRPGLAGLPTAIEPGQ